MKMFLSSTLIGTLALAAPASAALIATTDYADFQTALGGLGATTTLDFEGAAGQTIADGDTFGGIQLDITESNDLFGFSSFTITDANPTTSGSNSLVNTDGTGFFLSGDSFSMTFASSAAIGLYVIVPGTAAQNDQILLEVAGVQAALDVTGFGPGANAFFLGIYDDSGAGFTSASLSSTDAFGGFGAFGFYVDDITVAAATGAAPVPGTVLLLGVGLVGLGARRARR